MSVETINGTTDYYLSIYSLIKSKLSFLKIKKEQLESDIEECEVQPGGYNEREKGVHFFSIHYRAVFYLDRLPADRIPYLMAFIESFICDMERASDEELPRPQYELVKLDKTEKRYNLELYIDLIDDVYLVETEGGPIEWNGKTYEIAENEYLLAEDGTVEGGVRES